MSLLASVHMYFATLIVTEPTEHNLGTALDRDITTELGLSFIIRRGGGMNMRFSFVFVGECYHTYRVKCDNTMCNFGWCGCGSPRSNLSKHLNFSICCLQSFSTHSRCSAFAGLQQRWGIFWKPLRTNILERQILIIRDATALHNLCVDAAELHRPFVPSRRPLEGARARAVAAGVAPTEGELRAVPRRRRGRR